MEQHIRREGIAHTDQLGWVCNFGTTERCAYHMDAARTYWALLKLQKDQQVYVGKVLDCIQTMELTTKFSTRVEDQLSNCLNGHN